jgi:hypothetical protein
MFSRMRHDRTRFGAAAFIGFCDEFNRDRDRESHHHAHVASPRKRDVDPLMLAAA